MLRPGRALVGALGNIAVLHGRVARRTARQAELARMLLRGIAVLPFFVCLACHRPESGRSLDACAVLTSDVAAEALGRLRHSEDGGNGPPLKVELVARRAYPPTEELPGIASCLYAVPQSRPYLSAAVALREGYTLPDDPGSMLLHITGMKAQMGEDYPIAPCGDLGHPASWDPVTKQITVFRNEATLFFSLTGVPEEDRMRRTVELARAALRKLDALAASRAG